jgi:hypothetical protein
MSEQPIAKISPELLARLIEREFPNTAVLVTEKLKLVKSDSEQGRRRISAAILRLASGDFEKLDSLIHKANYDFRDIISAAEYPRNAIHGFARQTYRKEKSQYQADWKDYTTWLDKAE